MNHERRKQIDTIIEQVESVITDEQDAYDRLTESLQCAKRGEQMQAAIDSLQTAVDSLTEAKDA